MAKRGLKRGRWIIAGVLVAFVIAAAAVIARRSYGHGVGLEVQALARQKANLESERVRLDQLIRSSSAHARIVPLAERRLGMHLPSESQVVFLGRPPRTSGTP